MDLLIFALDRLRGLSGSHVEFVGVVIQAGAVRDDAAGEAAEENRVGAALGILGLPRADREEKQGKSESKKQSKGFQGKTSFFRR